MWCWHHIKENLNNLCPACRNPYHDNPHAFSAVEKEEIMRNKREMKLREKEKKEKNKEKREAIVAATGVQRIPLPSEHPLTLRRNRAGSDSEMLRTGSSAERRRSGMRNSRGAAAPAGHCGFAAGPGATKRRRAGRRARLRSPTGTGLRRTTSSLGGEYGFGRAGRRVWTRCCGTRAGAGAAAATTPTVEEPPLDVAGL